MKDAIVGAFKVAKKVVIKKSPEILLGLGISGFIASIIFAAVDTPKAMKRIGRVKRQNGGECTVKEKVKAAAPCYVRTVVTAGLSTAALICSERINHKRNVALASAYAISELALKDYQNKLLETAGEKGVQKVIDGVADDKLKQNPIENNEAIITGRGDTLCYDSISGRYFYSDIELIRQTVNNLNKQLIEEQFISQNELFYELGMEPTGSGYELGWSYSQGLIEIMFSSKLATNGKPCLVLQYRVQPKASYLTG